MCCWAGGYVATGNHSKRRSGDGGAPAQGQSGTYCHLLPVPRAGPVHCTTHKTPPQETESAFFVPLLLPLCCCCQAHVAFERQVKELGAVVDPVAVGGHTGAQGS